MTCQVRELTTCPHYVNKKHHAAAIIFPTKQFCLSRLFTCVNVMSGRLLWQTAEAEHML